MAITNVSSKDRKQNVIVQPQHFPAVSYQSLYCTVVNDATVYAPICF